MRVLIAGGGIAGLSLAIRLRASGIEAVVLERSDLNGPAGAGLSLMRNGMRALDRLGLGDEVRRACGDNRPTIPAGIRSSSGRWVTRLSNSAAANIHVVDRADLRDCLVSLLDVAALRTSAAVTDIRVTSSEDAAASRSVATGVILDSGEDVGDFDVVVGADGVRSVVRRRVWGAEDPGVRNQGYFACRGLTEHAISPNYFGETWGRAKRFGLTPLADGRVYWFSVANGEPVSPERAHEWTMENFGSWNDSIRQVISSTPPDKVQPLPIESLAGKLSTFVQGNTVLVGDAAHAMPPNLGQGANQALCDVAVLAEVLESAARAEVPIADALEKYDRKRRRQSQMVARTSDLLGKFAQAEKPPLAIVRNAITRPA